MHIGCRDAFEFFQICYRLEILCSPAGILSRQAAIHLVLPFGTALIDIQSHAFLCPDLLDILDAFETPAALDVVVPILQSGRDPDMVTPRQRPPPRSRTGIRSSADLASLGPAKRTTTPPRLIQVARLSRSPSLNLPPRAARDKEFPV